VYKGDLGGIIGGCTSLVAIKTLRPGANTKSQQDFQREIELYTELRHQVECQFEKSLFLKKTITDKFYSHNYNYRHFTIK
jgi:hypothetical protein